MICCCSKWLKCRFQPKSNLKNITFGISYFSHWQPHSLSSGPRHVFLLISGGVDTLQTQSIPCLFYTGNLQTWKKVKSMVPPDFVWVWIYVQTKELEFFSCRWCWSGFDVSMETDLKLRQARSRDFIGWTSLRMLFGVEGFTCSREMIQACFLLIKSSLLNEEPGLVAMYYIYITYNMQYIFKEIWTYRSRIPISAQRAHGACCCSHCCLAEFYLFMILSHHTAEFWPPVTGKQDHCFALWLSLPRIQFFVITALYSPVMYFHVHFNVFLGCCRFNPFQVYSSFLLFSCYQWYISLWSAEEQIKPSSHQSMVLDL